MLCVRLRGSVEQVQFFSRFEADRASRGNWHFRSCSWIASNARFPGFDAEHAKAAEFNAIPGSESVFHAEEDSVNGCLSLDARQSGAFRNFMYHVLFDQVKVSLQDVGCARCRVSPC
jgi:hypothetical protein